MAPAVRLSVLGSLRLARADGADVDALLVQPRRVALLVYLALAQREHAHRRDTLLALFWPDHDTTRARNALNQAVHFLRRSLGADVVISRGDEELQLDLDQLWCDARAFETLLDTRQTIEALQLHRGPFLEGFHVSDVAPELDRWIDSERERLERRNAQALQTMADERDAAGDAGGAVVWYRKLVEHDPLSARSTHGLMRALAALGEVAAALQQARIYQTLIAEEVGAAPDPQIEALVKKLKAGSTATAPSEASVRGDSQVAPSPNGPEGAGSAEPPHLPPPPLATTPPAAPPGADPPLAARPPARKRSTSRLGFSMSLLLLASLIVPAALLPRLRHRGDPSAVRIGCVTVLPFENQSGDSSLGPLADALADATITELARFDGLRVISFTTAQQYKHAGKALPEIGRALDCDGLMEGAVTRDHGILRVQVQMLYAPDDRHLWAEAYDGDTSDVLGLEERVSSSAARHVQPLAALQSPDIAAARRPDPIAYEMYLRGRDAFRSRNPAMLREASAMFQAAIARDTMFAAAYAGLADTYRMLVWDGDVPTPALLDTARSLSARALAADSNSSDAHVAVAGNHIDRFDWTGAETEYRRAIQLQPGNPLAHHWYAMLLVVLDRRDEALREIRRAAELDPLSPATNVKNAIEFSSGIRKARGTGGPQGPNGTQTMQTPTHPGTLAWWGVTRARQHRCAEAYDLNRRAQELAPDNTRMMIGLVGVHTYCGKPVEARALLEQVERRPDAPRSALYIAEVYAAAGQNDSAFAWLDHSQWSLQTLYELRLAGETKSLRTDSRYPLVLAKFGLR